MQELFDFSTLYQTNPIFSEPDLRFSCNFEKLKDWWHHLCLSKKAALCRLDLPEIIHDLKETSNGAFLLCNLNAQYKQKALITCKRHGNKTNKDLLTHEYEFNFKDKDMLPINSARIFSTYHLQIYNTLDLSAKSLSEDISGTSEQSTIKIKKEYLNDVPDMLRNFIADFAMENQLLLRKEEYGKIYSVLSEYSFNKLLIFRQIQSSSVQRLLHKLVAVTIILGNNVMMQHQKYVSVSLCNQTLQIPTIEANSDLATDDTKVHSFCFRTQDIKSLSSIQPNGHDNRKFSELETEISNEADIQIHQNTSNENLKNLSQSQDSNTKETSHGHSIQSNDSTIIPYLLPQHLGFPVSAKENLASGASVSGIENENQGEEYNRMFGDFLSMYEGYQICNLQIDFEPSDTFLIKLGSNEEIVYEKPSESYESLFARKYSSNPLYGKRNLTSGADDFSILSMQKNATDTLDTNEVFSINNMYGYYGAGWTTPRRGKAHDDRGAWRTGENLSHEKKEAPMESRIYGGIRETLPWGEDSYAKDYGHKGHFKGQGGKKEVKIYYAKAKNNGDVQKKTQQPRFQSRKEGLVET